MNRDKVFLSTNIKTDYDLRIESEDNIKLISSFLKSKLSFNILVIDNESNPHRLFSKVITYLNETYDLVESFSEGKTEQTVHVNLDLRLAS